MGDTLKVKSKRKKKSQGGTGHEVPLQARQRFCLYEGGALFLKYIFSL